MRDLSILQKDHFMLSCPNCEFENNTASRPVIEGDLATCPECGNSWKEYSSGPSNKFELHQPSNALTTATVFSTAQTLGIQPKTKPQAATKPIGIWSVALVSVALLMSGTFTYFENRAPTTIVRQALAINDISIETNKRQNGVQIVTVRGKISNQSLSRTKVPQVTIVLRDKRGSEISRWKYQSMKVSLNPGSAARFSSSIQHASTQIASAELLVN